MIYKTLRPALFRLPAEQSHNAALQSLRAAAPFMPAPRPDDFSLATKAFSKEFSNPLGMAAGFDKDGIAINGLLKLGFGFAEIGTLTPAPQAGNPQPRLFREPEARALINRLGFNNQGMRAAHKRLLAFRKTQMGASAIIGVNIGANRNNASDTSRALADYSAAAKQFAGIADYLTLNVSSPNTPNLRALQEYESIKELMEEIRALVPHTPLLVKLAPELGFEAACQIAELAAAIGIEGLIISNTTTSRAGIKSQEQGGISGAPLFDASTQLLSAVSRASRGRLTLIGVGGIMDAQDAYAKIRAGASLLQIYTGLVYGGTALIGEIKRGLCALAAADGFARLSQAIGADHKED